MNHWGWCIPANKGKEQQANSMCSQYPQSRVWPILYILGTWTWPFLCMPNSARPSPGTMMTTNSYMLSSHSNINTLRPRQCFQMNFLDWKYMNFDKNSIEVVPRDPISNIPALAQIMAWRRPGDKPLSEPMTVSLLTHICVTRPQWVKIGYTLCLSYFIPGTSFTIMA